jgi:hypothetical protein
MELEHLTDREIAQRLARDLRAWRVDPCAAGMTQTELASRSGVGLTPLKRFEKTGGITLNNLVALLRALNLLDALETLIPKTGSPSPIELLKADRAAARQRQRAPRARPMSTAARSKGSKKRG